MPTVLHVVERNKIGGPSKRAENAIENRVGKGMQRE